MSFDPNSIKKSEKQGVNQYFFRNLYVKKSEKQGVNQYFFRNALLFIVLRKLIITFSGSFKLHRFLYFLNFPKKVDYNFFRNRQFFLIIITFSGSWLFETITFPGKLFGDKNFY